MLNPVPAVLITSKINEGNIDEKIIGRLRKIHLEKVDLIAYSHREYFPLPEKALESLDILYI